MKSPANCDHVFGFQLLLDFYGCKKGVCDDLELCYDFLDAVVDDLGMKKQSPPEIFHSDEKLYPDKAGLSGWVPLIESSVVIHTLSKKNFITIDIYSCRCFDQERAESFCRKYFRPKKVERQFLERGMDYYKIHTRHHTMTVSKGKVEITRHTKK
jgi:S-adenosylmethionine decarboxylase